MSEELSKADRARLAPGMEPVPLEKADRDVVFRHFVDRIVTSFPDLREELSAWCDQVIASMTREIEHGDELWVCRSRFVGTLAGHVGLGIVRDGVVIKYEAIIRH
ncbi:hypothetical protein [Devosia enhydra]|uniref:hypothetical protein n=1 Tax=Devosia enhydra TaxID=665118 RepID=UPI00116028EF|nr:hypothetical protein [Devosia enhydra]